MYEYEQPFESADDSAARYERDMESEHVEARDVLRRERLAEHRSDFKPPPRIIEDQLGWEQLRRAKLAACRVCGDSWLPQLHHLVPVGRTNDGDDVPANLVPLCRECHQEFHDAKAGVAEAIRATLTEAELEYVTAKKSVDWLERRYPRESVAA